MVRIPLLKDIRPKRVRKRKYNPDDKSRKFYCNSAWQGLREAVIMLHPTCLKCENEGRTTLATQVHHIVPFLSAETEEEQWKLLLNSKNVIPLCNECHHLIHAYPWKNERYIKRPLG